MNKPKGKMTEGPWEVVPPHLRPDKHKGWQIWSEAWGEIAMVYSGNPDEANAYWISKAWAMPELLEALYKLMTLPVVLEPHGFGEVFQLKQALGAVSKAIAKIEGEE